MINILLNIICFFYKKLRLLIINDINIITNNCQIISQRENNEQKKSKHFHDNNCPNCQATEDNIVNKLNDVQGKITIKISQTFGYKLTNVLSNIDTNEINHCNVCGNEWKKFKLNPITKAHILKVALKYLSEILKDPKEREKDWKVETIEVFKDSHAETIYKLSKHNSVETIRLRDLKKHYKSIFK